MISCGIPVTTALDIITPVHGCVVALKLPCSSIQPAASRSSRTGLVNNFEPSSHPAVRPFAATLAARAALIQRLLGGGGGGAVGNMSAGDASSGNAAIAATAATAGSSLGPVSAIAKDGHMTRARTTMARCVSM